MEDNQTDAGQTNLPQIPAINENIGNSGGEQPNTSGNGGKSDEIKNRPIHVTVNIQSQPDNEAAIANQIAIKANEIAERANASARRANVWTVFALISNAVIIVLTYFLFNKTIESTDAAVKSANTADSTLQDQRAINKQAAIDKYSADTTNERRENEQYLRYREQFRLDSTSTQAQIDAFKKQSERFAAQNLTYIEIAPHVEVFEEGEETTLFIKITSIGEQPVKLESCYLSTRIFNIWDFNNKDMYFENLFNGMKPTLAFRNKYLPKGQNTSIIETMSARLEEYQFEEVALLGTQAIYTAGRIKYENLVTKEKYVYDFLVQTTYPKHKGAEKKVWDYTFRYNENYPLPESKISY